MADRALHLIDEPDPDRVDALVRLRAEVATDIANGQRSDFVMQKLSTALQSTIPNCTVLIITVSDDVARIRSSDAPSPIQRAIHGQHRRNWFGAWAAVIARRSEVIVPEVAASSLYRDHRRRYIEHQLLSARAMPLHGRNAAIAGSVTVYLEEQRLLTPHEIDVLTEVSKLASLSIRHDQATQELLDRIRHDPLTGLENRDGLEDHIRRALDSAHGRGGIVALLFVDIDDLTLVNDSLGHTSGDIVIATTAERIKNQLLPSDAVVRFGGDEFIVVLERIDDVSDAQRVAERIRSAIGESIMIDDNDLHMGVSIGITTGDGRTQPLQLIDEGHAAVVRAKQSGPGSTAVHDRSLDTGAVDRLDRERALRDGLDNNEFVLFWQPKVSLSSGCIVGAEALVRWQQPELGLLGPGEFIATAERAGLIDELSDWILRQAMAEAAAFAAIDPHFSVAVNMSATQLTRPGMREAISDALDANLIGPEHLIVELTESILANHQVEQLLDELGDLGIRAAIDDFGTGYSSLAYVQELPVNMVKIDRAFLEGFDANGNGAPVLKAAVAMAQALGMTTVVEGVETRDQLVGLRLLGVDWAQGYLFSEPCPQANIIALIESGTRW